MLCYVDARRLMRWGVGLSMFVVAAARPAAGAPAVLDPNLTVQSVVGGLNQPTSIAFIGADDFFVLEKASGQVKRVTGGVATTVLDLAVNFASERGLLGIALSPDFATDQAVYLYWTASSTGADTNVGANVPLLGNRVDRFTLSGSALAFDQNIAQLRALQTDDGTFRGNHNGGVIEFGPDGKLYVVVGDVGRRGQMQNLPTGPFTPPNGDDAFGGPEPDDAHLTGVVLRLNPDGTTPGDNPFFAAGESIGGEAGANVQQVFAYGIRNSFGAAFDPVSGSLWMTENGDTSFDEVNRVAAGMNGGWVQVMGPLSRIDQYKDIEVNEGGGSLQQSRWPPSNIADNAGDALAAMFALPGSVYTDPQFSWKYVVAPAGLGFLDGGGLGAMYAGDLFVGAGIDDLDGGYLYRFDLDAGRMNLSLSDPLLADLVADNLARADGTESESLRFGTGFGVVTDIVTGPDGRLYVVSLTDGQVYVIAPLTTEVIPAPVAGVMAGAVMAWLCVARRRGRRGSSGG